MAELSNNFLDSLGVNNYGMYVTSDGAFQNTSGMGVLIHYGYGEQRLVQVLVRYGGILVRQKFGENWTGWTRLI